MRFWKFWVWNRLKILYLRLFWRWLIITAEEKLLENGYEGVKYLTDFSYDDALIGVTHDNRAVYDYEKMVEWLISTEGFTEEEAIEWIDYNTLRAIGYFGEDAPIIMYPIEEWYFGKFLEELTKKWYTEILT